MNEEIKYTDIVDEVLHEKKLNRSWLAKQINISNQNMSYHWKRGTFPLHLLERIEQALDINLREMKVQAKKKQEVVQGMTLADTATDYEPIYTITLTRSEMRAVLLNQGKELSSLRQDLERLKSEFIDHLRMAREQG